MWNNVDKQYLETLQKLTTVGNLKEGRNGSTRSLFGHQMRFNLQQGFPIISSKRIYLRAVVAELLWFLSGDTNIKYLVDNDVHIWDAWADEHGDLGPIYGSQWRSWLNSSGESIDQITELLGNLKNDPFSRRHVISAWNVGDLPDMALPPCHCLFQFYVREVDGVKFLDCQLYQRSADWFLGVPFNITSYALLTYLIAREVGMVAGEFIHTFGDYHLYTEHTSAVREQLERLEHEPRGLPMLLIKSDASIFDLTIQDIELVGYNPYPTISAPVAV